MVFKRQGRFIAWLRRLRFGGAVDALPEGTVFFADEPVLRVLAPLPQAQLVETRIINLLQYQTLVASKAARARLVAPVQQLVALGLRRAPGAEAGLLSARPSYLARLDGPPNVLAGLHWGIAVFGTIVHAFLEAPRI